ncbi:MAG: hypothetical protein ACOC9E_03165, partial [Chloroflexota bacterium]
ALVSGATFDDTLTITNLGDEALNWTAGEEVSSPSLIAANDYASVETFPQRTVTDAQVQLATEIGLSGDSSSTRRTDFAPPAVPPGLTTITHSNAQTILPNHFVWCPAAPGNAYLRVFDLAGDFDITSTFEVTEVVIGVLEAVGESGDQPLTVNLYTLDGVFEYANMTLAPPGPWRVYVPAIRRP